MSKAPKYDNSLLRDLRIKRGLSVDEMAAAAGGLHKGKWINIEHGCRQVRPEDAENVANALGVPIETITPFIQSGENERCNVIRDETLIPFGDDWTQPTGEEVRAMLAQCELTGSEAAALVGVKDGRTVRKWTSFDPDAVAEAKRLGKKHNMTPIPFAAWAILAERAGYGCIWKVNDGK